MRSKRGVSIRRAVGSTREHGTVFGDAGSLHAEGALQHHELVERAARGEGDTASSCARSQCVYRTSPRIGAKGQLRVVIEQRAIDIGGDEQRAVASDYHAPTGTFSVAALV
ncbi:hypothetical protein [Gemmatimonas sp.]|uniref:hypothetical protein n=1 Tax=Gemmatimonas sp. TaxID=1962908 RepID=UPI00286E1C61|nr:hypothetical protein [Gemmatimonas sp.]